MNTTNKNSKNKTNEHTASKTPAVESEAAKEFWMSGRNLLIALAMKYNGNFDRVLQAIKEKEKLEVDEIKELLARNTTDAITILDEDYPDELKRVHKPPLVLFLKGNKELLTKKTKGVAKLAVIGARECSEYGVATTNKLVGGYCSARKAGKKPIIVSGMAKGIDAIAHKAALDNDAPTIAVLAGGVNYVYPKENKDIYDRIAKNGLIISEKPNTVSPDKEDFPLRNRIIAALADKTLVIEAKDSSGTVITVMYALSLGKDVLAIPTSIDSEYTVCNKLIQDGAFLVQNLDDLIYLVEGGK